MAFLFVSSPFTQLFDMMIGVFTASLMIPLILRLDKLMFNIRTQSNANHIGVSTVNYYHTYTVASHLFIYTHRLKLD